MPIKYDDYSDDEFETMPEIVDLGQAGGRAAGVSQETIQRTAPKIQKKPIVQRIFGIPFDFLSVGPSGAGASYVSQFTISTNFNFLWESTQIVKLLPADDATAPNAADSILNPRIRDVQLQIRDEFTSEDMFSNPIFVSMLAGDGRFQHIIPRPYVFLGGTTITVTVIDIFGAPTTSPAIENFRMQIALIGYKVRELRS